MMVFLFPQPEADLTVGWAGSSLSFHFRSYRALLEPPLI
jgi:hypothetical protein